MSSYGVGRPSARQATRPSLDIPPVAARYAGYPPPLSARLRLAQSSSDAFCIRILQVAHKAAFEDEKNRAF